MIKSTPRPADHPRLEKLCLLILILVGSADFIFIVLHPASKVGFLSQQFDITQEGGYAELFQYVKEFWCTILLLLVAWQVRSAAYLVWALFFGYLLADDMLQIHENGGELIAAHLDFASGFGLRARDLGELTVTVAVVTILLSALSLTYWHSTACFRKVSLDILLLLVGLAFFGVAMDMLHVMVYNVEALGDWASILGEAIGLVEDGGEMLMMSLMVWYLFLVANRKRPDFFLWQSLRLPFLDRLI
jgi:hypothetical protein